MATHRDYAFVLKPMLPQEAFRRYPARFVHAAAHLAIVIAACLLLRRAGFWPWYLLAAIVIGHSLACLAFFAHELSHNSIVKPGALRSVAEMILWGLNWVPATLWDEVHNHTHHLYTNTLRDTDRRFTTDEKDARKAVYTILLYPHSQTMRWNPLVLLQFMAYIFRQIISAMSGGHWGMLPANPEYTWQQRVRIAAEIILIVGLQFILYALVGFSGVKYVFVGPVAIVVASAVVMSYVFTNHFLDPLQETTDALASTTSVIVPRWFDWLHFHLSYHVEHHLFPSMDSRYYPQLSRLLQQSFPEEYKRIPIAEAWRQLWKHQSWESRPGTPEGHAVDGPAIRTGSAVRPDA